MLNQSVTCSTEVFISPTALNLMAGDATNATLQCSYYGGAMKFYHEFGGEVIDILDVGQPVDEEM